MRVARWLWIACLVAACGLAACGTSGSAPETKAVVQPEAPGDTAPTAVDVGRASGGVPKEAEEALWNTYSNICPGKQGTVLLTMKSPKPPQEQLGVYEEAWCVSFRTSCAWSHITLYRQGSTWLAAGISTGEAKIFTILGCTNW